MTNIEFVKFIVYGEINKECSLTDSEIYDLNKKQGVNSTISILANAELVKLAQQPNSVSDGAVSMSWSERRNALLDVLQKAKNKEYFAPESENNNNNNGIRVIRI